MITLSYILERFSRKECAIWRKSAKIGMGVSSRPGKISAKTAPMNTVIPIDMAKYEVFTGKRWKRSARKRKPFNAIWQMVSTIRLVKSPFLNWLTDI